MALMLLRPFEGCPSLQREWDVIVQQVFRPPVVSLLATGRQRPSVDVSRSRDTILARLEVPGVKAEAIEVAIEGRYLTIRGVREHPKSAADERPVHTEMWYGPFERTVELPELVDATRSKAKHEDGILTVTMPIVSRARSLKVTMRVIG